MAEITFRLMGETTVARDGATLALGARMHRALLALLAVQANRVVSVDRLIDSLWVEPPGAATATLHAYVSQLRKLLEPERLPRAPARVIVTRDPGYLLVVPEENIDVLRFEHLAQDARSALEAGDAERADVLLAEAGDLWHGEPLAEFSGDPWAAPIVARLAEAQATASEDRMDAWLALGRHMAAATELERMVGEAPLRERRWAQLMLALYRSNRQADALRAYQRCRGVLGEELGIDPGPELRTLEQAILAQDPVLAATVTVRRQVPPLVIDEPLERASTDRALVAREAHINRLREGIGAIKTHGGALLLVGEPGIGKTTLAEAAVGLARQGGITTTWSRCPDLETSPPYWVWTQLLSELEPLASVTAALEMLGGSRPAPDAEGVARFESYQAVLGALLAAGPLVAVIDDLHAADESSLAVLRLIAGDLHRLPVFLVVTVRNTEGSVALNGTLGEVVRQRGVERLAVAGLSVDEVAQVGQRALGITIPSDLAVALHDRTGGNPFYLRELLRLLGSEHRGRDLTTADVASLDVPAGVRDVVGRRVAALPADTQAILTLAAVAGYEVDLDVLEAAAGIDSAQLMLAVEPAVASGLLVERNEVWGYRFTHGLIRDALTSASSQLERARLHARIAEALEQVASNDPARPAEIAHHFIQAGPLGDPKRAVEWSLRAADRAEAQSAWSEAAAHIERAVAVAGSAAEGADRQRCDLLRRLGQCKRLIGDVVGAQVHLDESIRIARAVGDPERATAAAVIFGTPTLWSWRSPGEFDPVVINTLEDALLAVDDPATEARVMGTLGMELYYTPRKAEGERYADRAVALARTTDDVELLGRVLNNALLTNWSPGHDAKALAITEESLTWAGRGLPRVLEIMARMHRMLPLVRSGDIVGFDIELARSRDLLGELRMVEVELAAQVDFWDSARRMLEGRWSEARRVLERAVDAQRHTSVWGADFNMMVGEIAIRRATGGLEELTSQLMVMADQPGGQMLRPAALLALVEAGDLDDARRRATGWWAPIRYDWAWYWLFPLWGDVAAAIGTPDAEWAYNELVPYGDAIAIGGTGMVAAGSTHAVLARLAAATGNHEVAIDHARRAVARERQLGLRGFEPRSAAILSALEQT